MFFMGLTLTAKDFQRVLVSPKAIGVGVFLQFLIMPAVAYCLSVAMNLPPQLAAGLILVGCCAGGTASNVICFLAKGDLALSISMTLISSLLGVILTPLLCQVYIAEQISVDHISMLWSIAKMVLLPVLLGIVANHYCHSYIRRIEKVLPTLSITAIVVIIAIIVALNKSRLSDIGGLVFVAVLLHNGIGMIAGFWLSRLLGMSSPVCRTIAIEVGMQNSGLGVALALKYFSATAALPGAVFSIWHNIAGSAIASFWRSRSVPIDKNEFESAPQM
jgi:bile acid:Na+ symporter, BASS family